MNTRLNTNAQAMARGLGWFSLALGAMELMAPGTIRRQTGMVGPKAVLPAYGMREIATGLAILTSKQPVTMVWARVAGDLLDLATAAPVLRPSNPQRRVGGAAFGFLLLATVADVFVAMQGDRKKIAPPLRSGVRLQTRPADLSVGYAPAHRPALEIPPNANAGEI